MCVREGGVGEEDDPTIAIDLLIMFRFSVLNSLTIKKQTTKFSSAN